MAQYFIKLDNIFLERNKLIERNVALLVNAVIIWKLAVKSLENKSIKFIS